MRSDRRGALGAAAGRCGAGDGREPGAECSASRFSSPGTAGDTGVCMTGGTTLKANIIFSVSCYIFWFICFFSRKKRELNVLKEHF